MTAFWIISGIFIVVTLLFIIPTLLRNKNVQEQRVERDAVNISVYRDQLKELERDLENDILTQEQYDQSKQELQQRMLQDVPEMTEQENSKKTNKVMNIAISTVIVLTLPVVAVYLYLEIGDTRGLLPQAQLANATQMSQNNSSSGTPEGHDNFASVLDNLIARLNNDPEDIEGWVMLGRTYAIMQRYDEAASTYAKLNELIPDNPQILSDYADILAMTNEGSLTGKPSELIQKALSIDPEYPKALALAGTVEFEQNEFDQAAMYWERLLAVIPADSQLAKSVNESIEEARLLAVKEPGTSQTQQISTTKAIAEEPQSSVAESKQSSAAEESGSLSISGNVTISDSIASSANPNDTLFIYARAESGPKMPLAILRLKAGDLPTSFTLTDEMAMTPAMKLSSFPNVIIEARISKSGQAVPASGDLQGLSAPVKIGNNNVTIVIDSRIP
ncbi:cytochrome c-type biogenesis protein CcmH [Nitrosomonas aestuarii]|uniref:Cytochrome c-type biogenesis protein CcmH n=1 Tax=Nitrosomonas aestuarii TaxID=52441 RepID=A0A1I4AA20_9PROT|nr:c-type cytochrome biogenesis protein CcmI [Nitrosomonas aestuarii]SFK53235.1 cytochrome c-type biogenesis protein CcmH [Nitrosomonas aestuarii]